MPYVRSPDGKTIGTVPPEDYDKALTQGYMPVSDSDLAAAENAKPKGGFVEGLQAAGEGALKGAVGAFTAPARALGALAETAVPPNENTQALRGMMGENALGALGEVLGGKGEGEKYIARTRAREVAHPYAEGAGELAGSALGLAPGLALAGAVEGTGAVVDQGARLGATQAIAQASDEARQRNSALTGENALVAGGLGALLGGTLNFAGKKAADFLSSRATRAAERYAIPELEAPPERLVPKTGPFGEGGIPPEAPELSAPTGTRAPREVRPFGEGGISPEAPELNLSGEARPTVPAPPTSNAELMAGFEGMPAREGGMGMRTPTQGGAETPTIPALETTNAEVMGIPKAPKTGFENGGIAAPPEVFENPKLRFRGGQMEDELVDMRRGLIGEDLNVRNRVAKVARLMDALPDDVHPDWLDAATPKQRLAITRYAGVPDASDDTWEALVDAVAERAGLSSGKFQEVIPATGQIPAEVRGAPPELTFGTPPPEGKFPEVGAPWEKKFGTAVPMAGYDPTPDISPSIPAPWSRGQGSPVPMAGYEPTPDISPPIPPPYKPAIGGATDANTLGESIGGSFAKGGQVGSEEAHSKWKGFLSRIAKYSLRSGAGHAVGSIVGGGPFGPVAYVGGLAMSELYARAQAGDAMGRIASKGVKFAESSLGRVLGGAAKFEPELKTANTIPSAIKFFLGGSKTPEAAFEKRISELEAIQANPALLSERVGDTFGHVAHTEQAAVIAVTQAAQRGVDYLLQNKPETTPDYNSLTPNTDATTPSRADLNDYARVYSAVMHPMTVLQDIKNGAIVADQIQAVKTVYPGFYQSQIVDPLQALLRDRDAKKKLLLPSEQRVVDIVLGTNTGINSDEFALKYGSLFQQALSSGPGGQSNTPKPQGRKLSGSSAIAGAYKTQTSNMLGPMQ